MPDGGQVILDGFHVQVKISVEAADVLGNRGDQTTNFGPVSDEDETLRVVLH